MECFEDGVACCANAKHIRATAVVTAIERIPQTEVQYYTVYCKKQSCAIRDTNEYVGKKRLKHVLYFGVPASQHISTYRYIMYEVLEQGADARMAFEPGVNSTQTVPKQQYYCTPASVQVGARVACTCRSCTGWFRLNAQNCVPD